MTQCGQSDVQVQFQNLQDYPLHFEIVAAFFYDIIQPLYGDQTSALTKIQTALDRQCELMLEKGELLGLLLCKLCLTNEFEKYFVKDAFEIKTLALLKPAAYPKKGYGRLLLLRAADKAIAAKAKGIIVTASSGKQEVLDFFTKSGFSILDILRNRYVEGLDEYVFFHSNPIELTKLLKLQRKNSDQQDV